MTARQAPRPGGIVCPLATPLTSDGRLAEGVLRAHIDALVPSLDGLFLLGSSGELTWLRDEVAERVVQVAVEQVAGRIPIYVGIGDTGLERTLARADRLAVPGVDYLVVASPFYYRVDSDAHLVDHFATIADRVPTPVVLYNIPQSTHLPLPAGVVRTLAAHPHIIGIKDSAGDWFAFAEFLALRADGFSVLQGREQLAAISFWSGADGLISGMSNIAPRLLQELAASIRDERPRADTLALQDAVDRLGGVFAEGDWLAGLKATLGALGWEVGDPSRPMPPCDGPQRAAISRILAATDDRWLTRRRVG